MRLRLTIACVFACLAAQAQTDALHNSDPLPAVAGQSLSGKQVELPAAVLGKTAVMIFGFSRAGGDDAQKWHRRLEKEYGANQAVAAYSMIMFEEVPRLLRGMIVSGIKRGAPPAMHDKMVVVYHDEAAWKSRLSVSDTRRAYVVLLDSSGHIRWMNNSAFSEAAFAALEKELQPAQAP
jgi:hypothetical protein